MIEFVYNITYINAPICVIVMFRLRYKLTHNCEKCETEIVIVWFKLGALNQSLEKIFN